MTNRERFRQVLEFKKPDRLPVIEWASWWNQTLARWHSEGLPEDVRPFQFFGLDRLDQSWIKVRSSDCPGPITHGSGIIETEEDYNRILPNLFNKNAITDIKHNLDILKPLHDKGETTVWMTLEGFFWFPRVLFGIENHFYSFYDQPELYHRICSDLSNYYIQIIDEFCEILTPDFMTIAEDMSFNSGPMLSKECYDEFIKPYYLKIVPHLKKHGIKVFVDSDGDVKPLIPWLRDAGIEGILPLERQAGVDVNELRQLFPDFLMIGGFNKLIMKDGEAAMRKEFERILPAMKSGGYIPGVDHQTPPDVSIENYKTYVRLLNEYAKIAAF